MRDFLGQPAEYLTIQIFQSELTVMVPVDKAEEAGLRGVIGRPEIDAVVAVLRGEDTQIAGNWNRRFRHNRDKLRTGDVLELAEVIRNLARRAGDKGLSSGERQMFAKAKGILASELQYALGLDEAAALAYLDEHLAEHLAGATLGEVVVGADEADEVMPST
jgi:CarD family transcriptional regulator